MKDVLTNLALLLAEQYQQVGYWKTRALKAEEELAAQSAPTTNPEPVS